jgi:predicted aldo/keto reductase-like oxidoreductase
MTQKNNNLLNYLLVFALMVLPLQSGMAAVTAFASEPVEVKQVCHEMAKSTSSHGQHQVEKMDKQQHANGCCDKDMNCQQCADCLHCPTVSIIPNDMYKPQSQGLQYLYTVISHFPDTALASLQFRPPRA